MATPSTALEERWNDNKAKQKDACPHLVKRSEGTGQLAGAASSGNEGVAHRAVQGYTTDQRIFKYSGRTFQEHQLLPANPP